MGQMHTLKDYVNHELVPILTMDPNSSMHQSTQLLKSNISLPLGSIVASPLTTSSTATTPTSTALLTTVGLSMVESPLLNNITTSSAQATLDAAGAIGLTGVYTLTEEPELEAQETQIDNM